MPALEYRLATQADDPDLRRLLHDNPPISAPAFGLL
jgi:hypothetical protein